MGRPAQQQNQGRVETQPQDTNAGIVDSTHIPPAVWDPMPCNVLIEKLKKSKSIKLVALDFDQTIVDIHTGGRWPHGTEALILRVRPSFQCFIVHCLLEGISVAVTTFSKQTELIERVVQKSLRQYDERRGQRLALDRFTIPVYGGADWVTGYADGKESQLLLAMKHFNRKERPDPVKISIVGDMETKNNITPEFTLLVDDDPHNVEVARDDGYQTFLYPTKKSENLNLQQGHHH